MHLYEVIGPPAKMVGNINRSPSLVVYGTLRWCFEGTQYLVVGLCFSMWLTGIGILIDNHRSKACLGFYEEYQGWGVMVAIIVRKRAFIDEVSF